MEVSFDTDQNELRNKFILAIEQANTIPLVDIFKSYGLNITSSNRTCVCPFKKHKGGRETGASFNFYHITNSFNCFGCKTGGKACDFVAAMEDISKAKAAFKLIKNGTFVIDNDSIIENRNLDEGEKLELLIEFSSVVRLFIKKNNSINSLNYAEEITLALDRLLERRSIDSIEIRGIEKTIKTLTEKLESFQSWK
jgi:hypothetical protein